MPQTLQRTPARTQTLTRSPCTAFTALQNRQPNHQSKAYEQSPRICCDQGPKIKRPAVAPGSGGTAAKSRE